MTFLQLCQATRQESGIQGQGPSAVTSQTGMLERVVGWVRDADRLVQTIHADWDFLHNSFSDNTTEGSDALTKPSDFGQWDVESFALSRGTAEGRELRNVDYKEWRKNHNLKENQEPNSVTIAPDNNLLLGQPADGIYTISGDYWREVVDLAVDGDIPPYPARFHRVVIARAKMFFFEDQEAWENYRAAKIEYDNWLNDLEAFALPGQRERSKAQAADMTVVVE